MCRVRPHLPPSGPESVPVLGSDLARTVWGALGLGWGIVWLSLGPETQRPLGWMPWSPGHRSDRMMQWAYGEVRYGMARVAGELELEHRPGLRPFLLLLSIASHL